MDMETWRNQGKPHVQYRLLISTITIEGESSNPRWSLPGKVKYKLRRRLDKQILVETFLRNPQPISILLFV